MPTETVKGVCPLCEKPQRVVDGRMTEHNIGKRGARSKCPGTGREPVPAVIEALTDAVIRTLVPRHDYVRLQGCGARVMFSVKGLGHNDKREWLEVYGPLDKWGHETKKARHRSVTFDQVTAKVRNPPKKEMA